MTISEKEFKKHLALYGASIENWPDEVQAEAIQATYQPGIRGLMIEQRYFEDRLRSNDVIVPASPWLIDRIINTAGNKKPGISITAWLEELLASVLPKPAFALATILTLGIVIGFGWSAVDNEDNAKLTYEDAAL